MSTDFLLSLPADQQAVVSRQARGSKRPSYFDSQLAVVAQRAKFSGVSPEVADTVQISEDLEAIIILLPTAQKQNLLSFLQTGLSVAQDANEVELLNEMVSIRSGNYAVVNSEAVAPQSAYTKAKGSIRDFLENARETSGLSIDGLVPDLDRLFATLNEDIEQISRPEILELHNHITDTLAVFDMTAKGTQRQKELLSWINVFKTYL